MGIINNINRLLGGQYATSPIQIDDEPAEEQDPKRNKS